MCKSLSKISLLAVTLLATVCGVARADVLLNNTKLVAATGAAPASEFPFTTSAAEALTVTLTDLQQPAAFSSLQVAVTLSNTLVGSATADPSTHTASVAIPAAIGSYVLRVIGTPVAATGATVAVGSFGACVTRDADATPRKCVAAYSFSGNIETPTAVSSTSTSVLQTNFTATTSGTYTITLADDGFPVALSSISGGIAQGSVAVGQLSAGTNQLTLSAGTVYTLVVAAVAGGSGAGLYGVNITDPSNTAVFFQTVPVGSMTAATTVSNPTAQALKLTLQDLQYPSPLASVGVAVTFGSSPLAILTASGNVPSFSASSGNLQLWQYSASSGNPGVYTVNLAGASSGVSLYANTQVVNPSASTGQSFAFARNLTAGGTYTLAVTDFQFPSALSSTPTATVAQNGTALTVSNGTFTAAAGYIVVVVNAAPPASSSGIFGVTVSTSATPAQIVLQATQTVGSAAFTTQTISVTNAGNYDVTLADLGFPGTFQDLDVIVSHGSDVLGKIFGAGTFTISSLAAGDYALTFIDTPSATLKYGLYSIEVASSVPSVSFTAGATSIASGGSVLLTWSSKNTTTCSASGSPAWTGTQSVSGSTSVTLSATSALVLTCTGPGGSASQTVNVAVTAVAAKSSGGGGALDLTVLSVLAALVVRRRWGSRNAR